VQIEIATPDGEPETSIGGVLAAADYGSTTRCCPTPTSSC
jgi:hypothetical protein